MFLDPNKDIRKHRFRLPHWHQDGCGVFLTWRLGDSLPEAVVERMTALRDDWISRNPKPWTTEQAIHYQRRFILPLEKKLDDHHGACVLREPRISQIVSNSILHFNGERYEVDAFVIMPNHVHLIIVLTDAFSLKEIVHSIKSYTAKEVNRLLHRSGTLWQSGYWDRLIRSGKHLSWTRRYIAANPKGLPKGHFRLWSAGESRQK